MKLSLLNNGNKFGKISHHNLKIIWKGVKENKFEIFFPIFGYENSKRYDRILRNLVDWRSFHSNNKFLDLKGTYRKVFTRLKFLEYNFCRTINSYES